MTIVKKGVNITETLIGYNGRILGLKLKDIQIWNVYPPSGSENKNKRETFFREDLCNLMMNWKDHSKYVFRWEIIIVPTGWKTLSTTQDNIYNRD